MTIKFSEKAHRYTCDGKPIKGVTTLIKGGWPNGALMYWSAKMVAEYVADHPEAVQSMRDTMGRASMVAALKEVPWDKRDAKAFRGTEIHALGERVVTGEDVEVPEHLVDPVRGYAEWLDLFDVEPELVEVSAVNRTHWYAGRPDLVARIAGVKWLLDIKSGSGVYPDMAMQLDAYRNLEHYVIDGDPDTEHPFPDDIERLGVVHVTDAGTTLYPMRSDGHPFRTFLHVAYTAKQAKTVKDTYRLDPITDPTELEIRS